MRTAVQAAPCHLSGTLWLNTQPQENGTSREGWRCRAPSETLLMSAYETHTEISRAFLLGHVTVKTRVANCIFWYFPNVCEIERQRLLSCISSEKKCDTTLKQLQNQRIFISQFPPCKLTVFSSTIRPWDTCLSAALICYTPSSGHSRYFQAPRHTCLRSNKSLVKEAEPRKGKHCSLCHTFSYAFVTGYPYMYRFWWCLATLSASCTRTESAILLLATNINT